MSGSRDDPLNAAAFAVLVELVVAMVVAIFSVDECHNLDLDYLQRFDSAYAGVAHSLKNDPVLVVGDEHG